MFSVRIKADKPADGQGKSEKSLDLSSDTRVQFVFHSEYDGYVMITCNREKFVNDLPIAGGEQTYPRDGQSIPVSAFVHVSHHAKVDFEFIPSDDAPEEAKRHSCSVMLAYARNDFEPERFPEVRTIRKLCGKPRRRILKVTHMGTIIQGVRARTIQVARRLSGDFSPESLNTQKASQEARLGLPMTSGRHDLHM